MPCGRRRMICVPYRRIMRRSRIVRKVKCTIRVSPSSIPTADVLRWLITPLDTVWQLIGLTNWVMDFLERLMKECILFGEQPVGVEGDRADVDDSDDDLFGSATGR